MAEPLAARHIEDSVNSAELLALHAKITGGKTRTRFPPEPNGFLHIGHAKSMNMNFKMAFDKLGVPEDQRMTIFRYDDTNPEAESKEFIDALKEDLEWLGWKPAMTTFSSDYFAQLHSAAVELIKRNRAYVCHQTKADVLACREAAKARIANPDSVPTESIYSPYRSRSVQENLKLFEDMRKGKMKEGECTLRLKMDMTSPNPNMWDTVAYRIRYTSHPHAGDEWCIYPTYDFTHCLVDSFEHIDYSICTLEFETRRESYYWLIAALDLFRPNVYEFARLNITYTVLSKRKLLKLVMEGFVRGWDDPRMPTIRGLRRRGYTPAIMNSFCDEIGVARADGTIEFEKLQNVARQSFDSSARRVMACLDPIKVSIAGVEEWGELQVLDFPQDSESKKRPLAMGPEIYIDRSDFREVDHPEYFGLAPGKIVGLKYFSLCIRCDGVEKDTNGLVTALRCSKMDTDSKPKGWISWVPVQGAVKSEVRLYDHLFTDPYPSDAWESQLNSQSEIVEAKAVVDGRVLGAVTGDVFQFERLGYFVVDPDTTADCVVFNRTVTLRESGIKKDTSRSRKEQQEEAAREKAARMSIPPQEMFRGQTDLYSKFDDDGIPTHDHKGELLSKSAGKKLKKEWEKQKKLFEQNKK